MLVGNAGVGKTILVSDKVAKLKEDYMVAKVPFNYYTTSAMLQRKNHGNEEGLCLLKVNIFMAQYGGFCKV